MQPQLERRLLVVQPLGIHARRLHGIARALQRLLALLQRCAQLRRTGHSAVILRAHIGLGTRGIARGGLALLVGGRQQPHLARGLLLLGLQHLELRRRIAHALGIHGLAVARLLELGAAVLQFHPRLRHRLAQAVLVRARRLQRLRRLGLRLRCLLRGACGLRLLGSQPIHPCRRRVQRLGRVLRLALEAHKRINQLLLACGIAQALRQRIKLGRRIAALAGQILQVLGQRLNLTAARSTGLQHQLGLQILICHRPPRMSYYLQP